MYQEEREAPERCSDVNDRASVEEAAFTNEALAQHRSRMARAMPSPAEDGLCACGCGEEVEPARLRLGLGLALECAIRQEARR